MESFKRPKFESFFYNIALIMVAIFIFLCIFIWMLPAIFNGILGFTLILCAVSCSVYDIYGGKKFKEEVFTYLTSVADKLKNSDVTYKDVLELREELTFKCWNKNGYSIIPYGVEAKQLLEKIDLLLIHK